MMWVVFGNIINYQSAIINHQLKNLFPTHSFRKLSTGLAKAARSP